jgi:chromosome partitioning protein
LGWPAPPRRTPEPDGELSTGLGWVGEREDPQVGRIFPQGAEEAVSRETPPEVPVKPPSPSDNGPVSVSRETTAVAAPVRTAADVAAAPAALADPSTPMARAVEHQLMVREGRRFGDPLPRPARTRVMVVANQKGGVGKTTTTVNIAAALAQHGLRVLVVDLDPQGNASTALSVEHHRGTPSSYDVLVDGAPIADVVQAHADIPGLEVVPATIDLAGAEIELVSVVARESRLRKALAAYPPVTAAGEDRLDYVLIDCPPSLGLLTLNALVAGDEMFIPIQAEYYALEGLGQLIETVEMVRTHLNQGLDVSTILITMYDSRTNLAAGVAQEVREHFRDTVLRTTIPRSVRVSEAPSYGQSVMTYDPGSPGALSYLEAARELALRGDGAGLPGVAEQTGVAEQKGTGE